MLVESFLLLVAASYSLGGSMRCPGNAKSGEEVTLGKFWYRCENGYLAPKGCFAKNNSKLNVYDSYNIHGYSIRCEFDDQGRLTFGYKACVVNGVEYYPGQTYQENKYWYTCAKENDYLVHKLSGCVFDGHRYGLNATAKVNGYLYECKQQSENTCTMCPVGCVENGRSYAVGESYADKDLWISCTKEYGRVTKKVTGCIHNGRKFKDGERYIVDQTVYECEIRQNQAPRVLMVSCSFYMDGKLTERPEGCEWSDGDYVMKCMSDSTSGLLAPKPIKCAYKRGSPGGFELNPGCFKTHAGLIVGCSTKEGKDKLRLKTFAADRLRDAHLENLILC